MMNEKIIGRSGKGKAERMLEIDPHSEDEILLRLGPPRGRTAESLVISRDRFFEALERTREGASRVDGHTAAKRKLKHLLIAPSDDDRIYLRVGREGLRGYDFVAEREDFEKLLEQVPLPGTYLEDPAPDPEDLAPSPEDLALDLEERTRDLEADSPLIDDPVSRDDLDSHHQHEPSPHLDPPGDASADLHAAPTEEDSPDLHSGPGPLSQVPAVMGNGQLAGSGNGLEPPSAAGGAEDADRTELFTDSLDALSWEEPPSGEVMPGPYEYKVVPAPRRFCDIDDSDVSHEAATALEILANDMAALGWELYRVESIAIESASGPLLGRIGRPAASRMRQLVVFRRAYSFSEHTEEHPDAFDEPTL